MKKVIVGISSGFEFDQNYLFKGYPRMMLNMDYARSVQQAGGIPITLPLSADYNVVLEQVRIVDGILLSGGQDVNPLLYNEQPNVLMGNTCPERDTFEMLVIKAAVELNKPIFGICRGSQIINTYFGGTLYQDNSMKDDSKIRHANASNPQLPIHHVSVEPGSFLANAVKKAEIITNSFHHQSIKEVASGFEAVAYAPDGIVEAIEYKGADKWICAVQWHPEMMSGQDVDSQNIFKYFIENVGE